MTITIKNTQGQSVGEHEVKFAVITDNKGQQAVHDHVVAIRANRRSGTACTKTMGEVRGSGKKPWKQKGTGRARAGSFASPLWRGGGVTHGPRPRDYSKKVNKKVKQLALRRALSERLQGDVILLDDIRLTSHKTKEMLAILKNLGIDGTCLFVIAGADRLVFFSTRNIPDVDLTTGDLINTYDVLKYDKLVFTKAAFEQVEQRLTKRLNYRPVTLPVPAP